MVCIRCRHKTRLGHLIVAAHGSWADRVHSPEVQHPLSDRHPAVTVQRQPAMLGRCHARPRSCSGCCSALHCLGRQALCSFQSEARASCCGLGASGPRSPCCDSAGACRWCSRTEQHRPPICSTAGLQHRSAEKRLSPKVGCFTAPHCRNTKVP